MRPGQVTVSTVGNSAPIPLDWRESPFEVSLAAYITGTVNYTVQYTLDDLQANGWSAATANWIAVTGMSAATAAAQANLTSPVTAIRLVNNTGTTGSVTLAWVQAGVD